jgi:hypothetical protein
MAKKVETQPSKAIEWLTRPHVQDIYSVSGCISDNFADYIKHWKHNGYWFFDSPEIIRTVAQQASADLQATSLFYYEVHDLEFEDAGWQPWSPEPSLPTKVVIPKNRQLEGFDVVTFWARNSPECSPLSCNGLAEELPVNEHCLFATFEQAEASLNSGAFKDAEPGPYRIFAVYTVPWSNS